jgi:hypothetical protein
MKTGNGANAQRRTESACIGANRFSTARCRRKVATLIPAILMVLQHQHSMVPSNGANAQRRTESACIGADSFSTAKCKHKFATLIPAILMVLQHQYGPKQ